MPVNHTKNSIEVRDVSFSYETSTVLDRITLNIHEGDYLGLVGPNGGGKTTLLKVMLGLLSPSHGDVLLFGMPVEHFHEWSRIGYVPQKATHIDPLFPATVNEVVAMGRFGAVGLCKYLGANDRRMITDALAKVGMSDHAHQRIGDLSPGQQQRVFIARALAAEPRIIFLDEPTVGIDATTQEQFYSLLKNLNQDLGITLVLVSHDIDIITHEVTELACINQTLVYHGQPDHFLEKETVQQLYGHHARFIAHTHPQP